MEQGAQIVQLLAELVGWVKFANRTALRETLVDTLKSDNDRAVYELTDGSRTPVEFAREVGISRQAVGQKWAAWRDAGIVFIPAGSTNNQHLATLKSLSLAKT